MPLPFSMSAEEEVWNDRAKSPLEIVQDQSKGAELASDRAWFQDAVLVLNSLYEAPQSLNREDCKKTFAQMHMEEKQANERVALEELRRKVKVFFTRCRKDDTHIKKEWPEYLRGRVAGYEGGVMAKAQELTWEQVEQALPPLGMSACVDARALAAGRVKEILANPNEVIKPKELWPKRARKGRIMATVEEAKKICLGLVKRGLEKTRGSMTWKAM